MDKNEFMYRVTREDRWKRVYNTGLTRVVTKRSLKALIQSASEYARYKIVKIEKAPLGEFVDVTKEFISRDCDCGVGNLIGQVGGDHEKACPARG